jgi:hypothetical protein
MIEKNLEVIKTADWAIDFGPKATAKSSPGARRRSSSRRRGAKELYEK